MRIGEVLVVGAKANDNSELIRRICPQIETTKTGICWGMLQLDDQMALQLYGINWEQSAKRFAWDLLCQKALGVIVVFDWEQMETFQEAAAILDYFNDQFAIPIVVAAKLEGNTSHIPEKAYRGGLTLSKLSRFTFYQPDNPQSIRQLIVDLININLEVMPS
ncbi:hypothetical protein J7K19_00750 [bacterium]|nr:hypothetical protein [bacterium]